MENMLDEAKNWWNNLSTEDQQWQMMSAGYGIPFEPRRVKDTDILKMFETKNIISEHYLQRLHEHMMSKLKINSTGKYLDFFGDFDGKIITCSITDNEFIFRASLKITDPETFQETFFSQEYLDYLKQIKF